VLVDGGWYKDCDSAIVCGHGWTVAGGHGHGGHGAVADLGEDWSNAGAGSRGRGGGRGWVDGRGHGGGHWSLNAAAEGRNESFALCKSTLPVLAVALVVAEAVALTLSVSGWGLVCVTLGFSVGALAGVTVWALLCLTLWTLAWVWSVSGWGGGWVRLSSVCHGCGHLGALREVLLAIVLRNWGLSEVQERSVWLALADVGLSWGLRGGA